jgi:hypothetical protein
MKTLFHASTLLLLLLAALPAVSDDQQKAQKLLNKVTAMAADASGRRAVSLAISGALSASRQELARTRHLLNLNYGDVFLVYSLAKSGSTLDEIGAQMKSGKTAWQIASERNANWKQLASDAKKLNGKIDDNLLRYFTHRKADLERDVTDGYNPLFDSVVADTRVSPDDVTEAQNRYAFLRDHAGVVTDGKLDTISEHAAQNTSRPDPIRNGGPTNPDTNTRPTPH